MTKKHYIALAYALKAVRPSPTYGSNKHMQWERDLNAIADVCAQFNQRFNRDLWVDYIYGVSREIAKQRNVT